MDPHQLLSVNPLDLWNISELQTEHVSEDVASYGPCTFQPHGQRDTTPARTSRWLKKNPFWDHQENYHMINSGE